MPSREGGDHAPRRLGMHPRGIRVESMGEGQRCGRIDREAVRQRRGECRVAGEAASPTGVGQATFMAAHGGCRGRADEALRADHLASPSWSPSMGAVIKGNICIIYAAKNH